uniref:Uncharacterized protein n=1 Tax=Pseudoalteromonas citrea DSM 8771 TaxID=1117314 RepID=U1JCA8_9GAMM
MQAMTDVTKLQGWIARTVVAVSWTLNQVQGDEGVNFPYARHKAPPTGKVKWHARLILRLSDEGQNP